MCAPVVRNVRTDHRSEIGDFHGICTVGIVGASHFGVGAVLGQDAAEAVVFGGENPAGIATGGLKQTIDNLGKPYISQDEAGVVHYTGAFSSGELDLRQYTGEQLIKVDVNCALSSVTVIVPEDCVVKLKRQSALSQIQIEEQDEFVAFGEEERVLGSGSTIVELTVRTGLAKVRIQTE